MASIFLCHKVTQRTDVEKAPRLVKVGDRKARGRKNLYEPCTTPGYSCQLATSGLT